MSWTGEGHICGDDLQRALQLAGTIPQAASWRRFLDGLALWLSAMFLAAAVILFFAYNWKELGHFSRFGIVQLLLGAAVLAASRLGLDRTSGKAALLVATLLVGALLALVGQTYQTGADPWELFATWALFVLPWIAISRFAPLWLVLIVLVNLAFSLYYQAFDGLFGLLFGTRGLLWALTGVNTAVLVVWELSAVRVPYLAGRWAPRLVVTAVAVFLTLLAAWGILEPSGNGFREFCGYAVGLFCAYAVYRRMIPDLYVLALGVLSLVVIVTVFLSHNMMRGGDAGAFLFIGLVALGLSAAGGWWLREVAREVNV